MRRRYVDFMRNQINFCPFFCRPYDNVGWAVWQSSRYGIHHHLCNFSNGENSMCFKRTGSQANFKRSTYIDEKHNNILQMENHPPSCFFFSWPPLPTLMQKKYLKVHQREGSSRTTAHFQNIFEFETNYNFYRKIFFITVLSFASFHALM